MPQHSLRQTKPRTRYTLHKTTAQHRAKMDNKNINTLQQDLHINIRILSADLVGINKLQHNSPLFCLLVHKGKALSQTKPTRDVTKTPIWNQVLSFMLPKGSPDVNPEDRRTLDLSICQQNNGNNGNNGNVRVGTGSLHLCDVIYDQEATEFGGELVLHDGIGNKIGRLMFKTDSDYPHNNNNNNNNNNTLHLPVMATSPIRTHQYTSQKATSDSQRYLQQLKHNMEYRSQKELNRQDKLNAERLRIIAMNKKRKEKRNNRKKKKILLPPGPASYNLPTTLESGGGRFSNANPKSYIDWSVYRAKQTPGPNEYGFGDRRPTTSGGRFNTSKPKSEIDWVIYHSKQVPASCDYQKDLKAPRKAPGGGKISEARPKSQLEWVVYHSREIPAPNAYPPLPNPKINGGRFSNANPKSEIDWVIYRSQQTPSPNEYGDGGRPKTSGGRFNSSKPKSQLDWVSYFAARTPSSAEYTLPEGASSDYFTASINQSRPPGFSGSLYGSGVGSVRFPTGDSRPREGKWVRCEGGQLWNTDDRSVATSNSTSKSSKRRRKRRKKKKTKTKGAAKGRQVPVPSVDEVFFM